MVFHHTEEAVDGGQRHRPHGHVDQKVREKAVNITRDLPVNPSTASPHSSGQGLAEPRREDVRNSQRGDVNIGRAAEIRFGRQQDRLGSFLGMPRKRLQQTGRSRTILKTRFVAAELGTSGQIEIGCKQRVRPPQL